MQHNAIHALTRDSSRIWTHQQDPTVPKLPKPCRDTRVQSSARLYILYIAPGSLPTHFPPSLRHHHHHHHTRRNQPSSPYLYSETHDACIMYSRGRVFVNVNESLV